MSATPGVQLGEVPGRVDSDPCVLGAGGALAAALRRRMGFPRCAPADPDGDEQDQSKSEGQDRDVRQGDRPPRRRAVGGEAVNGGRGRQMMGQPGSPIGAPCVAGHPCGWPGECAACAGSPGTRRRDRRIAPGVARPVAAGDDQLGEPPNRRTQRTSLGHTAAEPCASHARR